MAIAQVAGQSAGNAAGNSATVSQAFTSNVGLDNLVTVVGAQVSTGDLGAWVAGDCTQSAGTATLGTITLDSSVNVNISEAWLRIACFSAIVSSGGSCTMQIGGGDASTGSKIVIDEFSGSWDGTRVDGSNSGSNAANNTTSATTGNVTSTAAALFWTGMITTAVVAESVTDDASFTRSAFPTISGAGWSGSVGMYRIVASSTTDQGSWTLGGANFGWAAALAVYKEASGFTVPIATHHIKQMGSN